MAFLPSFCKHLCVGAQFPCSWRKRYQCVLLPSSVSLVPTWQRLQHAPVWAPLSCCLWLKEITILLTINMYFPSFTPTASTYVTTLWRFVDVVRLTCLMRIHTNISTMVGDHSNEHYWKLNLSIWVPVNTTHWILCSMCQDIITSLTVMQLYIDGWIMLFHIVLWFIFASTPQWDQGLQWLKALCEFYLRRSRSTEAAVASW